MSHPPNPLAAPPLQTNAEGVNRYAAIVAVARIALYLPTMPATVYAWQ